MNLASKTRNKKPYFQKTKYLLSQTLEFVLPLMGQNLVPQNVPIVINNSLGMWAIYFHAFVVENCLWTHP